MNFKLLYDPVIKFLIETYTTDYATWLLGKPVDLTRLEPSELCLEPIRADSIVFLEGEDIILHIESQTEPSKNIFFRLLDYRVRLYRRAPSKAVRQVVIYLLPSSSSLVFQTSFEIPGTKHEFEVVRLWDVPVDQLLSTPGLMPLAVLSNTANMESTLREVAQKIDRIEDTRLRSDVAASTAILGALKLDKNVIKQVLRRDIMRESPMYQEILEEGKQEGRLEGKHEGSQERAYAIARNLLELGMSIEQVATATGLTIDRVMSLTQN